MKEPQGLKESKLSGAIAPIGRGSSRAPTEGE